MTQIQLCCVPKDFFASPAFSQVAIVPPGTTTVYVGGQNAVDRNGELVGGKDVAAQTRQVMANLSTALQAAGAGIEHLVSVLVLLVEGVDVQEACRSSAATAWLARRRASARQRGAIVSPDSVRPRCHGGGVRNRGDASRASHGLMVPGSALSQLGLRARPRREAVPRGGVRPQPTLEGTEKATPFHSQRIAGWGACGKTGVVPQNRPPRPEPRNGGHEMRERPPRRGSMVTSLRSERMT